MLIVVSTKCIQGKHLDLDKIIYCFFLTPKTCEILLYNTHFGIQLFSHLVELLIEFIQRVVCLLALFSLLSVQVHFVFLVSFLLSTLRLRLLRFIRLKNYKLNSVEIRYFEECMLWKLET